MERLRPCAPVREGSKTASRLVVLLALQLQLQRLRLLLLLFLLLPPGDSRTG